MRSSKFCVYKGIGAAKVGLIPPRTGDGDFVEKDGAVIIDATRSKGKPPKGQLPEYDWNTKIVFAIGMNDIVKLSEDIHARLVHDKNGAIKTFQLKAGTGDWEGTFTMDLSEKGTDGATRNVMVPMTAGEFRVFTKLLDRAIPKIIGW